MISTAARLENPYHSAMAEGAAHDRQHPCWRLRLIHIQGSDRHSQLGERDRHPPAWWLLDPELVVAPPNVLHEPCPLITTLALWSRLSPRIGRSPDLRWPWSHSTPVLAYCSVSSTCQRSPTPCRQGRAASVSSGVNRWAQR